MSRFEHLVGWIVRSEYRFAPYLVAEGTEEHRIKRQILKNIRQKQACAAVGGFDRGRSHASLQNHHAQKTDQTKRQVIQS